MITILDNAHFTTSGKLVFARYTTTSTIGATNSGTSLDNTANPNVTPIAIGPLGVNGDLRITCDAPTDGKLSLIVSYYKLDG